MTHRHKTKSVRRRQHRREARLAWRNFAALQIPDDFTPVQDVSLDTLRRAVSVQELLREEEQRAAENGMTVEELRQYQDLLLKRF